MKLLSICDPTQYKRPPLDVPTYYQQVAQDARVSFFHSPTAHVLHPLDQSAQIQVAQAQGALPYETFVRLGDKADITIPLSDLNLIFCRTLKPFPPGYLEQLQIWEQYVPFVNSPTGKMAQLKPDFLWKVAKPYLPETEVTANAEIAQAFFERHQVIVAKRSNSCGGRGVFKIWYQQGEFHLDNLLVGHQTFKTFPAVMNYLLSVNGKLPEQVEPIQFVRYLNRVGAGDKRVVVVDGEIYGAYLRRSKSGHWVNNVSGDGECELTDLTPAEYDAINGTVQHYRRRGLHTLGYDFLQDDDGTWRISEINAGNIGGFARLELLTGKPVMGQFIDWLIQFAQRESINACQVRPFTLADLPNIANIYNQAITQGGITMDTELMTTEKLRSQVQAFNNRETILVAERDNQVIGWAIIKRYSDRPGYRICCETSTYLDKAATGQGYGTLLQRALLARVAAFGYHHVVAKIRANNAGSIRFHQRFGYTVVGIQKEIGFLQGRWHDVAILQLVLPEVGGQEG